MSDIEIVDVKINGKRQLNDEELSPEEYLWNQLVDSLTGTITLETLRSLSKQHDMKQSDDELVHAIEEFSADKEGMTKEEFLELFKKCKIPIDSKGQIVT